MIDIMTALGLKKANIVGEASRVKKEGSNYADQSPDKLVRSPKTDTFTSSEKTDFQNDK